MHLVETYHWLFVSITNKVHRGANVVFPLSGTGVKLHFSCEFLSCFYFFLLLLMPPFISSVMSISPPPQCWNEVWLNLLRSRQTLKGHLSSSEELLRGKKNRQAGVLPRGRVLAAGPPIRSLAFDAGESCFDCQLKVCLLTAAGSLEGPGAVSLSHCCHVTRPCLPPTCSLLLKASLCTFS